MLYGGYARGATAARHRRSRARVPRDDRAGARGWGSDNPAFRQVFTSRFIPAATPEQLQWFNDLCLKTTTGEIAADLLEARGRGGRRRTCSAQVRTPTLVLHARDDAVVPIDEGRLLAARHSGRRVRRARLAQPHPARARAGLGRASSEAVLEFTGEPGAVARASVFAALSARERQVLALMADGLEQHRHRRAARPSARRRSATTRRTSSTSWASGRARRRSCSPATMASDHEHAKHAVLRPRSCCWCARCRSRPSGPSFAMPAFRATRRGACASTRRRRAGPTASPICPATGCGPIPSRSRRSWPDCLRRSEARSERRRGGRAAGAGVSARPEVAAHRRVLGHRHQRARWPAAHAVGRRAEEAADGDAR